MLRKLLRGEFVLFEFGYCKAPVDESESDILRFYNCILSVPIGNFKVRETIPIILIEFTQEGTLQVFDEKDVLLSEHNYTCVGYSLKEERVISLSSQTNIREMLLVDIKK